MLPANRSHVASYGRIIHIQLALGEYIHISNFLLLYLPRILFRQARVTSRRALEPGSAPAAGVLRLSPLYMDGHCVCRAGCCCCVMIVRAGAAPYCVPHAWSDRDRHCGKRKTRLYPEDDTGFLSRGISQILRIPCRMSRLARRRQQPAAGP